jgi:hypothetical protein
MPKHPRSNDPDHPRMLQARLRERQALDLRARGVDINGIAEQLGVQPRGARDILKRAIAALRYDDDSEAQKERRAMLQARLDLRRLEAARVAGRRHLVLYQGQPVTVTDDQGVPRPVDDDEVKLRALDRLRDCDHDEAALWGLNAASKFEHTGAEGGAIDVNVWAQAQLVQLAEVRLLHPEQMAQPPALPEGEQEEA